MGGYLFPAAQMSARGKGKGKGDAFVVDSDNISLAQRKNNLLRRLCLRRNALAATAAAAAAVAVATPQEVLKGGDSGLTLGESVGV